jgi:uncharacterized membrane protein
MGLATQAITMIDVNFILTILTNMFYWSLIIGSVGLLLNLRPIKRISDVVNDRYIFDNGLIATITMSVYSVYVIIGINLTVEASKSGYSGLLEEILGIGNIIPLSILFTIMWLLVMWSILIASMYFLNEGYKRIADRTNTEMFRKVGRLYYYGALLSIVFIGFPLLLAAIVYQLLAYKSLPDYLPSHETSEDSWTDL